MSIHEHKRPSLSSPRSRRRRQDSAGIRQSTHAQPSRSWAGLTPKEILARYHTDKTPPLRVLEVLIQLFNGLHTTLEKTVSYKTREERAQFLRRFFRDLRDKAGYRSLPDPRNFAHRHVQTMVKVWQHEQLSPGTIQGYLSYLRALAMWVGKPGLVRKPAHYGLSPSEYQRTESADRDKSWSARSIDTDAVIAQVAEHDPRVGASMRLCLALGLRLKESVMFRPYGSVVPFEATSLKPEERSADVYAEVKAGSKGGRPRWIPIDSETRRAAVEHAQTLVTGENAHLGDPHRDLKANLRRFAYMMEKFGITRQMLGVTAHGLRHECLNGHYEQLSGSPSPVRGGGAVPVGIDRAARLSVAKLAGHGRRRASSAYLGRSAVMRSKDRKPDAHAAGTPSDTAATEAPSNNLRDITPTPPLPDEVPVAPPPEVG